MAFDPKDGIENPYVSGWIGALIALRWWALIGVAFYLTTTAILSHAERF